MASSVRPRPNYYDVLGLSPAATQDEIGKAFVRGMGMFGAHPAAAAAQLSIAFETLRDPVRRRAYDAALGLRRQPEPRQWTMTVPGQTTRGFLASAPGPAEKAASETLERLQRLAEPQPLTRPEPARPAQPRAVSKREDAVADSEDMPLVEWKRPVLTVGALFIAAGLIGALAGSSLLDSQPAPQGSSGRVFGRPVAKAPAPVPVAVPAESVAEARPAIAPPRARHVRAPLQIDLAPPALPQQPENSTPSGDQVADAAPAADAATAPSAVETIAAAGLPLAAKVMARTIERIGYACGSVASATPAEGEAAGVYKVTCTSGDTYHAAPVGGRYRFRRWSRR